MLCTSSFLLTNDVRDLAENIGIAFLSPEEFFLGQEARPFTRLFDPRLYLDSVVPNVSVPYVKKYPLDMILHVGSPGSGKSTFYWNSLEPLGYKRINQDILKTVRHLLIIFNNTFDDLFFSVIAASIWPDKCLLRKIQWSLVCIVA